MYSAHDYIRDHLLTTLGYFERNPIPDLDSLRSTEWSDEYIQFSRNRMIQGSFRYGLLARQSLSKYDCATEAIRRIKRYQKTKNLEHLVDAGNCCMLAFIQGRRNKEHFKPLDDGEHAHESNLD